MGLSDTGSIFFPTSCFEVVLVDNTSMSLILETGYSLMLPKTSIEMESINQKTMIASQI